MIISSKVSSQAAKNSFSSNSSMNDLGPFPDYVMYRTLSAVPEDQDEEIGSLTYKK